MKTVAFVCGLTKLKEHEPHEHTRVLAKRSLHPRCCGRLVVGPYLREHETNL